MSERKTVFFTMVCHPTNGWVRVGNAYEQKAIASCWVQFGKAARHGLPVRVVRVDVSLSKPERMHLCDSCRPVYTARLIERARVYALPPPWQRLPAKYECDAADFENVDSVAFRERLASVFNSAEKYTFDRILYEGGPIVFPAFVSPAHCDSCGLQARKGGDHD